jgi:hypothetical protein
VPLQTVKHAESYMHVYMYHLEHEELHHQVECSYIVRYVQSEHQPQ